jgi:hypothetical protein
MGRQQGLNVGVQLGKVVGPCFFDQKPEAGVTVPADERPGPLLELAQPEMLASGSMTSRSTIIR